ncbi:hypothetical protein A1Q1_02122 [Trichosporon asahii var. asahii CBS 2479]|uniref:MMS19 nucleotide excision repair protein n=1 Tax=Trichosporon asahii var. asahii (strain ATCC 90039 / CBS 2479 / JCM 2466 / KCTC 7840 / NBRC 103889/ NCYC 2677 / UAMH 7654) TaxID=1186058 RepID=J5QSF3_TRIAS|nr:hypothetical protein A1Q1_02122 [Trichosporon asahii var. asahii CBS 2479]EJT48863.1 hypothetical protein A1Q1_02122 [Trichosporon asahii var. asahii CBS 2479]
MDIERDIRTQVSSSDLNPSSSLIQRLTFLSNTIAAVNKSKINGPATLTALTELSKLPTFDDGAAVDVYKSRPASGVRSVRLASGETPGSSEFINSYSKVVDGEKDPRNLMLLFQLDKVILSEFNVKDQIEVSFKVLRELTVQEMFDITFCYFPITFRPPPNDPYGITSDDLKTALRACLSASPYFAKQALPLFLEKYPTSAGQTMSDAPKGLGELIVKQSLEGLSDPMKNSAPGFAKCLASMIRASPYALAQALPQLFRDFNEPKLPSYRVPLINVITTLLLAARSVYGAEGATRRQSDEHSLDRYRDSLLDVMREGLRTDQLKTAAIRGSVAMAEIPDFLDALQVEELVKGIDNLLVHDNDEEVRTAALSGLKSIAASNPTIVQNSTLPLLFHALPDSAPAADDSAAREAYRRVLKALTELCAAPALFQTLVVRITTKLDLLSTAAGDAECTAAYAWDLLHAVRVVLDAKLGDKHVDVPKYYAEIVPRFTQLAVVAAQSADRPLFRDKTIFERAYAGFENGQLKQVVYDEKAVQDAPPLKGSEGSEAERNLVALYTALVRGLKPETVLPFSDADAFLASKVEWALTAQNAFQQRAALDLISAFVNKHAASLSSLPSLLETIWATVTDASQPAAKRQAALQVYFHALTLLRNELAYTASERALSLLGSEDALAHATASAFGILAESPGKQPRSHLIVKKLWSFLLPKLLAGEEGASGAAREPYLLAFAALLPLVPASLYLSDLRKLLPILLRALVIESAEERKNVITALTSVLETASSRTETDQLLHEHAEEIVDGLLRAGRTSKIGKVRAAALAGLGVVPDAIRYETLGKAKARVIRELGLCLDDPLRGVRREAVDTRAAWYTYGNGS